MYSREQANSLQS